MKIKNYLMLVIAALIVSIGSVSAQSYSLENVGRNALRNSGTILEGNIIKGYFYFYYSEKVSRKTANYEIVILDAELNEVSSETITESKYTHMLEASYNGSNILFKFYDAKEKMVLYRTMDNKGILSAKTKREPNKNEIAVYGSSISQNLKNTSVNAANKNTFIDIYIYKNKGYAYTVEGLDNEANTSWTYTCPVKKGVTTGGYMASNDDQILLVQSQSKSIMSKDYTFKVISIDYSGELNFEVDMLNSRYNMLPMNAFINDEDNSITVLGEYFDVKDKAYKAASKGIFVKVMNAEGDEISENFISWSRDVAAKVSASKRKDLSKYSVFFHDIRMTKDGKIIAIGEQYRKQVSAGGMALKMLAAQSANLSTDAGGLEIKVADMIILTLDNKAELESVIILEKRPNKVNIPQGYAMVNKHLMARLLAAEGAFDYYFTQTNEDNSLISIAYTDKVKKPGKLLGSYFLNIVNFSSGEDEPITDKIEMDSDASSIYFQPAKPGYILISEYYKKEQTMELRLEPINY